MKRITHGSKNGVDKCFQETCVPVQASMVASTDGKHEVRLASCAFKEHHVQDTCTVFDKAGKSHILLDQQPVDSPER